MNLFVWGGGILQPKHLSTPTLQHFLKMHENLQYFSFLFSFLSPTRNKNFVNETIKNQKNKTNENAKFFNSGAFTISGLSFYTM